VRVLGTRVRVFAIARIRAGVLVASGFRAASDPWLAIWLTLSSAGAIYSWSYDQVLLFVPLTIACGVLAAAGRERALARLALAGAATLLFISPALYAFGVARHDETFSIAVPVGVFAAIPWLLWPYRRAASVPALA